MKKLIMMSIFALSTMTTFAGNGEKEILVNSEAVKTSVTQEDYFAGDVYKIDIKITWTCMDGMSNSSFVTANPQTACLDATQLASIKSMYLMLYQTMYPDVCDVEVYETLLDPCI